MTTEPFFAITVMIPLGLAMQINKDARDRGMSRDAWIRAVVEAQFEATQEAAS